MWYYCLGNMFCYDNATLCGYSTAYALMRAMSTCMQGLSIPGLVYPPANAANNPLDAIIYVGFYTDLYISNTTELLT